MLCCFLLSLALVCAFTLWKIHITLNYNILIGFFCCCSFYDFFFTLPYFWLCTMSKKKRKIIAEYNQKKKKNVKCVRQKAFSINTMQCVRWSYAGDRQVNISLNNFLPAAKWWSVSNEIEEKFVLILLRFSYYS